MTRSRLALALIACSLPSCGSNASTAPAPPAGQTTPPTTQAPAAPAPMQEPAAPAAMPGPATPAAPEAPPTPAALEETMIPAPVEGSMPPAPVQGQWISLFNGENLDGWTLKMGHHAVNDNYLDTFRVEDGLLKVVYDNYGVFQGEFGHLFYTGFQSIFSYYRLRIEYRIHGAQVAGGPDWGYKNSGVMIHGQSPESMALDQDFPNSIEVQFLGSDEGEASAARPTGNVCSPGTHVVLEGQLITEHCVLTSSLVLRGDQWVTIEVEVRGNESVTHTVNGQVTARYTQPQYDPNDPNTQSLINAGLINAGVINGADLMLRQGTISLQAETHPVEFRKVEIMLLDPEGAPAAPSP